ncbi:hypothetical protein G7046_g1497 [Stylonectria norvegica]|nr:hypothetical protein G7046_g1497 [Stylonectria norvegica]
MARAVHDHSSEVPGTILLVDESHVATHRKDAVVLHPQPSSDPEDPLNWSRGRKWMAIGMVYLYVFAIGICTCVQYSALTEISIAQNISVTQLNLGTGLMFLFLGWGCLIWQPIAMTYGRRGVYIISLVLSIAPTIWSPFSHGSGQWLAARILLGVFASPVESLPEISVPDLFFAHERGTYMAIYAFVLFGSNFLAPFFAGFINDAAGWRWSFYFATILLVVCGIIIYFFLEETIYFRETTEGEERIESKNSAEANETEYMVETSSPKTLGKKLALFTKLERRPTPKQMFMKSWRALEIMIYFPSIVWAGLLYGTNLAWYNVINGTMSVILGAAPYNFTPAQIGIAYLSPFIFGGIASFWAGTFADWVAIFLAKRRGGIREAEHRLWALAVSAVLSSGGLLLWGVGASHHLHFMGLIFGIGFVTFGVVCGGAISLAYAVDCFKEISGETLVSIIIIRNTLGFAFSYAITPWIDNLGLQDCFISVAMISLVCTCTFLPMIYWGKSLRRFSARRYWVYVAEEQHHPVE